MKRLNELHFKYFYTSIIIYAFTQSSVVLLSLYTQFNTNFSQDFGLTITILPQNYHTDNF